MKAQSGHPASESECGGFFPPEFNNCPFCGGQLAFGEDHSDFWKPPFGSWNGLRLLDSRIGTASIPIRTERTKRWVEQEKESLSLPRPRGDYEFIVARLGTKSPILIAFDRTTGQLDHFSPAEEKWLHLTPAPGPSIGESRLPNWSWSAAFASGGNMPGFAVPTNESPVWINIDWTKGAYTPVIGEGECIGGAAALDKRIFIPVLAGDSIAVQSFNCETSKWEQIANPAPLGGDLSGEGRYFSVPIVAEGRPIIYWVGITGLVTFDMSNACCTWRPWETDAHPCQAVPQLGPPYRDTAGSFWQICYDLHDNAFRYYKLSGDENDREDVDGGRFSSGVSCFSKPYDLWGKPWAKVDTKLHDKALLVRAPLLCIDEESKATVTATFGSESILPLLEIVKDMGARYPTGLRIEIPNDLPIELRTHNVLNLNAPWELRLFIYQRYLFAYSTEEAVCHRWRLK